MQWISIQYHCRDDPVETLPVRSLKNTQNFPPPAQRDLINIAHSFGFTTAEDVDEWNKNIFHHLVTAMKYSRLFGETAMKAFDQNATPLPGNIAAAERLHCRMAILLRST